MTIAVAIDRLNCDRSYTQMEPLAGSHGYMWTVERAYRVLSVLPVRLGSLLDRGREKWLNVASCMAIDTRSDNWLKSFSKLAP